MKHSGSRLVASIAEMKAFYPQFSLSGSPIGTGSMAVWKGLVQPIQTRSNVVELLDDVSHDRPVEIFPGGHVEHLASCRATHAEHEWMEDISDTCMRFKLELKYGGDAAHPQAFVLEPSLPRSKWKHLFGDGSICPYPPWERVWSWTHHSVVDFMDHVLVWLIKSIVWLQARVWIGKERRHETEYLLARIDPVAQCWCSSGRQYQDCHRPKDERLLLEPVARILMAYEQRNPYFVEVHRFLRSSKPTRALKSYASVRN
jgi:hypothetical protein